MTMPMNRQVRLRERPTGMPGPQTWDFSEEVLRAPGDGEFVAQVLCISIDPAMRVWLNAPGSQVRHVTAAIGIGDVMRASVIARVQQSRHPGFTAGQLVAGRLGVQEYALCDGTDMIGQPVVPLPPGTARPSLYLGALGIPGLTGYFGLRDVGRPEPGQTVLVSGATGAVGSVVGQLARILGCRAVGIAGGPDKVRYLTETLGLHAAIDYQAGDLPAQIARHCPDGVDIYFDNAGGDILDAALGALADRGRVVLCGSMSQYTRTGPVAGPSNYRALLLKRGRMEGFIVYDYAERYAQARSELAAWIASGALIAPEERMHGIESFPAALNRALAGHKTGKLLVELQDTGPTTTQETTA